MAYSANILPKNQSLYTLRNASFDSDGALVLGDNGAARINLTSDVLAACTNTMRVTVTAEKSTDAYNPLVYVELIARMADDNYFTGVAAVSFDGNSAGTAIVDVPLMSDKLKAFAYRLYSLQSKPFRILDWTLSTEVADGDMTTVIDGVTQSLPHVLADYNTEPVTVTSKDQIVAMISCKLLGDTDIQGHFLATLVASAESTLYVRAWDNNIEELYCPLIYKLEVGQNVIAIPHAYLNRKKGVHSFTVSMQVSNGSCLIHTRGIMYTIDGGYLAKQLADIGMDAVDIALSQPIAADEPAEVYALGTLSGDMLVKRRVYNSNDMTEAAWSTAYSVGTAKKGAIEFDGVWVRRPGTDTFTIQTNATPTIFLIQDNKELTYQLGDDAEHKMALDTNVSQVSAVRGYKSTEYKEQDQGLICAYVKEGKAYYRTYAYNAATEKYAWYPAEQLGDYTDVVSIQVHRLNDYRIGFAITTATKNLWLITDRTYVGQAVPPERYNMGSVIDRFASVAVLAPDTVVDRTYKAVSDYFDGPSDVLPLEVKHTPVILGQSGQAIKETKFTFNGNTQPVKDIVIDGNTVKFILPEAVQGTVTVIPSDLIQLAVPGGYEALFLPTLTWEVVKHINVTLDNEHYNIGKIIADDIRVEVLGTRELYNTLPQEACNFGNVVLDSASIVVRPIITTDISGKIYPESKDFGSVTFDTASIVVLLVESQPI